MSSSHGIAGSQLLSKLSDLRRRALGGGFAYFGTHAFPGRVVKVAIGRANPPPEVTVGPLPVVVDEGSDALNTGTVAGVEPVTLTASSGP